ncbi:MAG: hypothetical protein JJE08_03260 [Proteiniphilum sp.]|nr:hypothetical protein [Proteiniphilum sp.]
MKKEEFKQKTNEVLNELADYISKLEDKAGDIAEDAKEEYREQLENLKGVKENLSSKLDEFESVADGKWDVVKESAGNFFASVAGSWKENFGKVAESFKKEKPTDETENTVEPDAPGHFEKREDQV